MKKEWFKAATKRILNTILVVFVSYIVLVTVYKTIDYFYLKSNETPYLYQNRVITDKKQKTADSLYLSELLYKMRSEQLFRENPSAVGTPMVVIIDTIFYNVTHTKLAFWGLCRLKADQSRKQKYIYKASQYYAFRKNLTQPLRISYFYGILLTEISVKNVHDYFTRDRLYFQNKRKMDYDTKPRYNWNDIRAWNGAGWDVVLGHKSCGIKNGKFVKYAPQDSILAKILY